MASESNKSKKPLSIAYKFPNDSVIEIPILRYDCPDDSTKEEFPVGIERHMFPMEAKSFIKTAKYDDKDIIAEQGISILDRHGNEIFTFFNVYDKRKNLTEVNKLTGENIYEFYRLVPTTIAKVNVLVKDERRKADLYIRSLTERIENTQVDINNLRDDFAYIKDKVEYALDYAQTEAQLKEIIAARDKLRIKNKEYKDLEKGLYDLGDDLMHVISLKEEKDIIERRIRKRTYEELVKKLADVAEPEPFLEKMKELLPKDQYEHYRSVFKDALEESMKKEKDAAKKEKKRQKLLDLSKEKKN
ncbi:MAG: hypothetical protein JSW73_01085 [Candidatus Woesearchaeota archaeon]|nr:MAG: hypothetical protein JSW73_01085 [Candidatus Woesearchaeota archaeon]